jgi:hypothetical protein
MLYDIAAIVAASPDMPLKIFSETGIDTGMVRRRAIDAYTPYAHDPIRITSSGSVQGTMYELVAAVDTGTIARQWLDVVYLAPADFVISRIERFGMLLGFGKVYSCGPLDFLGMSHWPLEKWIALGKPDYGEAYSTHLLRSRIFPAGTFLFRPVSYLAASLVIFVMVIRKRSDEAPFIGTFIVSAWLYWLTFVPLPIACDVRYSYYSCVAVMLALAAWYFSSFGRSVARYETAVPASRGRSARSGP